MLWKYRLPVVIGALRVNWKVYWHESQVDLIGALLTSKADFKDHWIDRKYLIVDF